MKFTKRNAVILITLGSILIFIIIPLAIYYISIYMESLLEGTLYLPNLPINVITFAGGLALMFIGFLLSTWAVYAQYKYGRGTPNPWLPPQKLVKEGPYKYSRNPMHLGNALYTIGIGFIIGSTPYLIISIIGYSIVLLYNKFIEEKELEKKFGDEFREYKEKTPFLIPIKIGGKKEKWVRGKNEKNV